MSTTQAPTPTPLPAEPADPSLPRPMADALLRSLPAGTDFSSVHAPAASHASRPEKEAAGEPSEAEPPARMADRERASVAHCRFAMQYLD